MGAVGQFLLHLGEMVLAMSVGMAVFGALFGGVLVAAGTSYDEALATVPELIALVLMFNMTVPMVLQMRHRGHSTARVAEMAGAMLAVGATACALLWLSLIESAAICGVECALMIPVTVTIMLLHRDEYSRPVHRPGTEVAG
jgi:hypothetical protein